MVEPAETTATAGRRRIDVPALVDAASGGDVRSIARLISLVEDGSPVLREVIGALAARPASAHIVGITGPPGVGKSTSTSALVAGLRRLGRRVAVLAIDPSSPFTGGALLGDRIRMGDHVLDPDVYIRSMASRGHLGGLSWAAPQAIRILDAVGFDVVLVETVGVGQSEVDIASAADTTVVVLAPGMGDGIQAAKAGILEVGDIYVINKADHVGVNRLRRELRSMLGLSTRHAGGSSVEIITTIATTGEGVDDVIAAVDRHREHLAASDGLQQRRLRRARDEIEAIALTALRQRWRPADVDGRLDQLAAEVVAGRADTYRAADELLAADAR